MKNNNIHAFWKWLRNSFGKMMDDYPAINTFIGVILVIVFSGVVLDLSSWPIHWFLLSFHKRLQTCKNPHGELQGCGPNEVDTIFYGLTAIATLVLVVAAYYQLVKLRKQSESELLLRMDKRWTSTEILHGKAIVHAVYSHVCKEKHLLPYFLDKTTEHAVRKEVGKKLLHAMQTDGLEKYDFVYLLNLLDFLETIGHLHQEQHIRPQRLSALFGESLDFYYQIFESYIELRQKNYPNIYSAFKKLHQDLP